MRVFEARAHAAAGTEVLHFALGAGFTVLAGRSVFAVRAYQDATAAAVSAVAAATGGGVARPFVAACNKTACRGALSDLKAAMARSKLRFGR